MCKPCQNPKPKNASTKPTSLQAWRATHYTFRWSLNDTLRCRCPHTNKFERSRFSLWLAKPESTGQTLAAHLRQTGPDLCASNVRFLLDSWRAWTRECLTFNYQTLRS